MEIKNIWASIFTGSHKKEGTGCTVYDKHDLYNK